MKKYFKAIALSLLLWLALPLVYELTYFAVNGVFYPALCEWLPEVFPTYNFVLDKERAEAAALTVSFISAVLAIFSVCYVTVRLDNERCEFMIGRTEGMYTITEGARLYYPRYFLPDLSAALLSHLPLTLLYRYLPMEELPRFLRRILTPVLSFNAFFADNYGFFFGAVLMVLSVYIARLLSGMLSLSAWRGLWLSDTVSQGR